MHPAGQLSLGTRQMIMCGSQAVELIAASTRVAHTVCRIPPPRLPGPPLLV